MKTSTLFLLALLLVVFAKAQNTKPLEIVKTFAVSGNGGWDYLSVHAGKLYVSHGMQVNIIDESTGAAIGIIPNTIGVHGIAFADQLNLGFTSNGRLNNLTVFDLKTNTFLDSIAVGENPDAIMFEPFTKKIVTCNGRSKDLSFVDPATKKVVATILVGGKPETAVADGKGKLFVNIEDKSEIVAIDLAAMKVVANWPITPGEEPTGLAFDSKNNRLFVGCNKLLMVVDATNGKVVSQITIGDGCDGVAFNNRTRTIYTSNGEGTVTSIHQESADKYSLEGNYPSKKGARTIAINEEKNTVYLPVADYDPVEKMSNGRPKLVPDSFKVLVMQ